MTGVARVLVTGASSGIGAASAARLHARGFRVFGTRRPSSRRALPEGVVPVEMDVRDESAVRAGIARLVEEGGALDGVVCNAGFGLFGSVEEVALEAARDLFETNFFGALAVVRAVLPSMRAARAGRILLVGSLSGRAPIPFQSHYSASKAALEALTLGLHNEVRPFGIRVCLIEPGDIDTPFNENTSWVASDRSPYRDRVQRCEAVVRASLPRAPGPEVVARAIERALTARSPRVRYTMGAEAFAVPWGRRLLPDRIWLRFVRSHFDC